MLECCCRRRRGNDHVRVSSFGSPQGTPGEFFGGAHHIAGAPVSFHKRAKAGLSMDPVPSWCKSVDQKPYPASMIRPDFDSSVPILIHDPPRKPAKLAELVGLGEAATSNRPNVAAGDHFIHQHRKISAV